MSESSQTLEELQAKVIQLTASVDETLKEKKDKEAAIKKAQDDSKNTEKETNAAIKSAEDDSKEKLEKKIAAIKKASEETDPEKRVAAIKKAQDDNDDTKKEANEELEKKVLQQAEKIDEMEKKASKPVLTYLANIYKNTLPEDKFTEFEASWKKMSLSELDNEIIKAQASLPKEEHFASIHPITPSQSIFEKSGSTEKTGTDKIDSTDAVDLFNKPGGPYN